MDSNSCLLHILPTLATMYIFAVAVFTLCNVVSSSMCLPSHSYSKEILFMQFSVELLCVGLVLEDRGDCLCPPILVVKGAVQQYQSHVKS